MTVSLKEFGCMLTDAQFELFAFICILMEGEAEAADVLQDTNLALWSHAERYDASRPFMPWARSFAYNQVRAFRLKQSRGRLVFDETLMEWFAAHAQAESAHETRSAATMGLLEDCLAKLSGSQSRRTTALQSRGGLPGGRRALPLGRGTPKGAA